MVNELKRPFFRAFKQGHSFQLFSALAFLIMLAVSCQQEPYPIETQEPNPTSTHTRAPTPSPIPTQLQPTATLLAIATADFSPLLTASQAQPGSELVIESFEIVSSADEGDGKRITLSWRSNGLNARLISGARQIDPPWWQIPATGMITVELEESNYADPPFTLQVFDAADLSRAEEMVEATVPFNWPCNQSYFFEPAPALCPAGEPIVSAAAEQPFEGGVMVWLEATDSIYVFDRSDSSWQRFEDTWSEEQPERDPAIIPPAERFQPIRGFGKVWRDNPEVREKLGWALGPELGFESILQHQMMEQEDTAVAFLKTFNGQVFALTTRGQDEGDWVIATS